MNILLNWKKPNSNFWIYFWIKLLRKKVIELFFQLNIPEKLKFNNPLNWILSWYEWVNHILNRHLSFLMKSPSFKSILDTFVQFLGTLPIQPVSMIPWLLNWIIFWIESAEFFLNWIIFCIEFWAKQYWIKYWMNHFLAKFKHWIRLGVGHH